MKNKIAAVLATLVLALGGVLFAAPAQAAYWASAEWYPTLRSGTDGYVSGWINYNGGAQGITRQPTALIARNTASTAAMVCVSNQAATSSPRVCTYVPGGTNNFLQWNYDSYGQNATHSVDEYVYVQVRVGTWNGPIQSIRLNPHDTGGVETYRS